MEAICEACGIDKKAVVAAIERIHGVLSESQLCFILQGRPSV
jgi:hypothetical protein